MPSSFIEDIFLPGQVPFDPSIPNPFNTSAVAPPASLALTSSALQTAQVVTGTTQTQLLPATNFSDEEFIVEFTAPPERSIVGTIIPASIAVPVQTAVVSASQSTGINPTILIGGVAVLGLIAFRAFRR